jgi:hypothetical protein
VEDEMAITGVPWNPTFFLSISLERRADGDGRPGNVAIYGRFRSSPAKVLGPELCRFSDAGNDEARHTVGRAASEKRQGTKSREVGAPPVPLAMGI